MSDREAQLRELAKKTVVHRIEGMEDVTVRSDERYGTTTEGSALRMDLYYPNDPRTQSLPIVVIVMGYPDPHGYFRKMGWTTSWARLMAASGLVAAVYETSEPATDGHTVLRHLRQNAATLGIDEHRIGIFAGSGHAVVALSLLIQAPDLKAATLLCPFTLDQEGATGVVDAATTYGFANPCAGQSVDGLPADLPLCIVRAGRDRFEGLNQALDRFLASAVARNLPVTFINHHAGPHGFDLDDDSEVSRDIIRAVLAFLQFTLRKV